jgi:succinate dehydrogenase / fumarate reductase iron-sulfur subunit
MDRNPPGFAVTAAPSALSLPPTPSAAATAFTPDELFGLVHSLDPSNRYGSSVGFMMHDTCLLYARKFKDGDSITIEPWRASAFPIIKDLMVDRSAFDRIIESGGYITAETGGAPDANLIPIPKPIADAAMDSAECIGCGACVAACPNGAANLFTAAKVAHLNRLPQGQAERYSRVESMVETMDDYFGSCTNHGECEAACPKEISIDVIALMHKDYRKAKFSNRKDLARS